MDADVALVIGEEDVAQRVVAGMFRLDAEAELEQAARAVRGLRADDIQRQRRQIARGAGVVQRGGKVGRGVGEGAVEVEQDGSIRRQKTEIRRQSVERLCRAFIK